MGIVQQVLEKRLHIPNIGIKRKRLAIASLFSDYISRN
ncbi:hypothetical protein C723_2320 [Christiangramia flava JLT2011]|uniref:Uncharacterized protein n=1 Tax=Christiangramia flava JLT2011 TaxID=1229726 RepID=A0A1L7I6F1_9FLAO|nr:hypothetical protein GRFL_2447 [Christiangramia flava JLT2011]OSS38929.1 hypothetical protein C723_2320 [Christiangramia flava JLT2011]